MSEYDELVKRLRSTSPERPTTDRFAAAAAIEALEAERDGLREALEPFVKHGKLIADKYADDEDDTVAAGVAGHYITLGDFRRAALTASAPPAPHSRAAAETQHRPPTPEPARD